MSGFEINNNLHRLILKAKATSAENPEQAVMLGGKPVTEGELAETFGPEVLAAWQEMMDARARYRAVVAEYLAETYPEQPILDPESQNSKMEDETPCM